MQVSTGLRQKYGLAGAETAIQHKLRWKMECRLFQRGSPLCGSFRSNPSEFAILSGPHSIACAARPSPHSQRELTTLEELKPK